jgi:hypothetical protein
MHGRQKFRSIHGGHAHIGNHHRIRPGASQFGQPFFRTHGQVSPRTPYKQNDAIPRAPGVRHPRREFGCFLYRPLSRSSQSLRMFPLGRSPSRRPSLHTPSAPRLNTDAKHARGLRRFESATTDLSADGYRLSSSGRFGTRRYDGHGDWCHRVYSSRRVEPIGESWISPP